MNSATTRHFWGKLGHDSTRTDDLAAKEQKIAAVAQRMRYLLTGSRFIVVDVTHSSGVKRVVTYQRCVLSTAGHLTSHLTSIAVEVRELCVTTNRQNWFFDHTRDDTDDMQWSFDFDANLQQVTFSNAYHTVQFVLEEDPGE